MPFVKRLMWCADNPVQADGTRIAMTETPVTTFPHAWLVRPWVVWGGFGRYFRHYPLDEYQRRTYGDDQLFDLDAAQPGLGDDRHRYDNAVSLLLAVAEEHREAVRDILRDLYHYGTIGDDRPWPPAEEDIRAATAREIASRNS